MSRKYLLDSNIYIRGFREREFGGELREFHRTHLPRLLVSAVVVTELLVGTLKPAIDRQLRRTLIEPFRTRRRFLVPSWQTWDCAMEIDRGLRTHAANGPRLRDRSVFHDILIAATAREVGATIVTCNVADFAVIARHVEIDVVEPWPALRAA